MIAFRYAMSRSAKIWDAIIGTAILMYCSFGLVWVYCRLAETLTGRSGIVDDMIIGVVSSALVAGFGFVLALWKGDEFVAYFAERRRLIGWRRAGRVISVHLQLALMQNMFSLLNTTARAKSLGLPVAPMGDALGAAEVFPQQYRFFAAMFEEIRRKGGDLALPVQWEALDEDEVVAVVRIPRWKPIMAELASKLEKTVQLFPDAIPGELRRAILEALLHLELFDEQMVEMAAEPPHREIALNLTLTIDAFAAIARFADEHARWFREYLAVARSGGQFWPSTRVRIIRASAPPQPAAEP